MYRYIDAVFPGEYGIPKPFYFFVLPSYWCGRQGKQVDADATTEVSVCLWTRRILDLTVSTLL